MINTHESKPLYLLLHLYISYQIKTPFKKKLCVTLLTPCGTSGHLGFIVTHVTCMALQHTVLIRYSTSVTYRTLCQASGHLVIYHECYGFERAFFTLRFFYLEFLLAFSRILWDQQFNLKVSRVSC